MRKNRIFFFPILCIGIFSCLLRENNIEWDTTGSSAIYSDGIDTITPSIRLSQTKFTSTPTITKTRRNTMTEVKKEIQLFRKLKILSPGRYIAYVSQGLGGKYYTEIVSENGIELGRIEEGGSAVISNNQKYISHIPQNGKEIEIFDIQEEKKVTHNISEYCFLSGGGMSWSSDDTMLAVSCNESIKIISVLDGQLLGEIHYSIDPGQQTGNYHFGPKWSPNGKWIAYFVQTMDIFGPFITDVSCMQDSAECEKVTRELPGTELQKMDWTPENNLAILDIRDWKIKVYNVETTQLVKEINNPAIVGSSDIKWSKEKDWIALGSSIGIEIINITTGETQLISQRGYELQFWYYVK